MFGLHDAHDPTWVNAISGVTSNHIVWALGMALGNRWLVLIGVRVYREPIFAIMDKGIPSTEIHVDKRGAPPASRWKQAVGCLPVLAHGNHNWTHTNKCVCAYACNGSGGPIWSGNKDRAEYK